MQRTRLLACLLTFGTSIALAGACESGETEATTGDDTSSTGVITGTGGMGSGAAGPTTAPAQTTTTGVGGASGGNGGDGGVGGNGGMGGAGGSATVAFHETFDNDAGFAKTDSGGTAIDFFSDGGNVYFGISDGTGGGDWDGDGQPSGVQAYTGFDVNHLTAQNLDAGGDDTVRIEWTGIDVSGLTSLMFHLAMAEFQDGAGSIDQDDFVSVEVQLDGGGYTKIFEVIGTGANAFFAEDTDLNGTADGTQLGNAAVDLSKSIAGTGSALDIRLTIKLDADDEDIGIDDVRVTGM
jgi:hypothetical protein